MHNGRIEESKKATRGNHVAFCVASAMIGVIIAVVLPSLSRVPFVKHRVDSLKHYRVNGNATFYTDQTAMDTFGQHKSER